MASEIVTLKDFIRESLLELVAGVAEAQARVPDGAHINPPGTWVHEGRPYYPHMLPTPNSSTSYTGTLVEFDIAVTATQKEGAQGGVGVFFGAITAGAKGTTGSEEVVANRMRFSVPVFYPHGK